MTKFLRATEAPAGVVTEFLTAFFSGEIERARSLVADDFAFRAPLVEAAATKDAYFAGAAEKMQFVRRFRILRQWHDAQAGEVSSVYELDVETPSGAASILMSEWHTVRDGRLTSTVMVFDTAGRGAKLLGDALGAHHG
jgi:ketosteroid isomerase-like protein